MADEEKVNAETEAAEEAETEKAEAAEAEAAEETEAAEAAEETEASEKTEAAGEDAGQKDKKWRFRKEDKKSDKLQAELDKVRTELAAEKDSRLRLAAEYDNYRKRTTKEKDSAYQNGVGDTIVKILPVYDNLERALAQATADEAYKKGVEMIMTAMKETLSKSGVEAFGEKGDAFDPTLHNAVMHTEDSELGENVVADVFQKGFRKGDKVIRFAMVRVAN